MVEVLSRFEAGGPVECGDQQAQSDPEQLAQPNLTSLRMAQSRDSDVPPAESCSLTILFYMLCVEVFCILESVFYMQERFRLLSFMSFVLTFL